MKRVISIMLALSLLTGLFAVNTFADEHENDMRAVWISTIYNSDYPKSKNNAQLQKQEFIDNLNSIQKAGLNTAIVQVRPKSDALYKSNINPWSEVLTGTQGKNPGYDPLEFMIEETHKKGMSFHAWLNPYRITTSGTDLNLLSDNHPAKIHPEWVITYNNALYYNPDLNEVKEYIRDTVKEIVDNYNVDGIHFDDYFYPSDYPLPEGEGNDGITANKRRENVNEMIDMVNTAIKGSKPNVKFGISPMGIWKNSTSDATGSNTKGKEAYYSVFSDARAWIKNGTIDYIVPQIYWETGHKLADYETLVKWWSNEVEGTNVKLYIGQGLYKDVVSKEIETQLAINKEYNNVKGSFFFSLKDITNNRENCMTQISKFYGKLTSTVQKPEIETPEPVEKPTVNPTEKPAETVNKPISGKAVEAIVTSSKIVVDGNIDDFEAYNIDGSNYFKLRDIAEKLSGTGKQFDTIWNEELQAINIKTATPYLTVNNSVGKDKTTGTKKAYVSNAKLMLDGAYISASAYNIDGNNYFKLRDIGSAINFGVIWNEDINTVEIDTFTGYQTNQ